MNQTFLDYNKKAISSGIIGWNSTVGHDLKEATQRFLHLAKNANLECDSDEPEQSQGSEQNFDYEARVRQSTALGSNSYAPLSEQSWLDTSIPVKRVPVGMWGYEVTSEPEPVSGCQRLTEDMNNLDKTDEPDYGLVAEQDAPSDVNLHQDLTDIVVSTSLIQDFQLNPSIDNHLTPDYTYSFQETTFARRLLRSSYETAFRLLNDPSTPRSEIYRRLRYTFCWANMDDILTCLQLILSRSNKESLENWDFPNLHTGNAGFHFPRGSLDNGAPPPEKWGHRKNIGPWRQGRAQNRDAEAAGPDSYAHFAKCEGTWFDPNDVEEYYKTKGLFLDGWSSVAELEIDAPGDLTSSREMTMGSPSSLSAESLLDPQSPLNYLANATIDIFDTSTDYFLNPNNDGDYIFPPARELEDRGVTDIPFKVPDVHSQPGVDIETQQSEFYRGQTLTPKKRKVIIDVDKLLESKYLYLFSSSSIIHLYLTPLCLFIHENRLEKEARRRLLVQYAN